MIKLYDRALTKAFRVIGNPLETTTEDIIKYLNTIRGNQYGFGNRHASFRALQSFYGFMRDQYDLPYLMKGVPGPFIDKESYALNHQKGS